MDERRVLLIGKRAGVLTRPAAALRARGIAADGVRDPTGAGVDPAGGYRVAALGRAVKPVRSATQTDSPSRESPNIIRMLVPVTAAATPRA